MKLSEVKASKLFILLYGPPMSGKTVLASQFPNLTYIDIDDSLISVSAMRNKLGLDFDFTVYTLKPEDDKSLEAVCGQTVSRMSHINKLKVLLTVLEQRMRVDETLVLDNLSRLYELAITHIQQATKRTKLQLQDWGTFVDELQAIISSLKRLAANVVLIAHEEVIKDELTGGTMRSLLMATKLRDRLPSMMTDVFRLTTKTAIINNKPTRVRYLQASSSNSAVGGSRTLVEDMENPTYAKLKPYFEQALGRSLPEPTWTPKEV